MPSKTLGTCSVAVFIVEAKPSLSAKLIPHHAALTLTIMRWMQGGLWVACDATHTSASLSLRPKKRTQGLLRGTRSFDIPLAEILRITEGREGWEASWARSITMRTADGTVKIAFQTKRGRDFAQQLIKAANVHG